MNTQPNQYTQPAAQPIIINNSNSAAASATSGGYGLPLVRKRQSAMAHFWLFMLTGGVGNYFYYRHCMSTVSVRVSH